MSGGATGAEAAADLSGRINFQAYSFLNQERMTMTPLEIIEDVVLIFCVPAMVFYLRNIHTVLTEISQADEEQVL